MTDCLNFGSPEDPGVMWQFEQAVLGLAEGCKALGVPVTGGNVSFYNQTGEVAIHPTPVVGVLGVMDDVRRRIPSAWAAGDLALFLLGTTRDELDGSEWAHVVHNKHLGGRPPAVDFAAEQALATLMVRAADEGLASAAHDLSDGGLAVALAEACLPGLVGVRVDLAPLCQRDDVSLFAALFSESTARALVAVDGEHADRFTELAGERGVPCVRIGQTGGHQLVVEGHFELDLTVLRDEHEAVIPAAMAD